MSRAARVKTPPPPGGRGSKAPPVVVAPPALYEPAPRYMVVSFGGSPDDVCRFCNVRFLPCWGTTDFAQIADEIRRTVDLGIRAVSLYVDWLMWDNQEIPVRYLGPPAADNLRRLCSYLQACKLLQHVKFFWMPDEPGRDKKISAPDFRQCALDMRQVASEYPELRDVGYVEIAGDANDPMLAKDLMTGLAIDDYGRGAGVLGSYDGIERGMSPEQFTAIVAGMYSLENKPMEIEAFVRYMDTHPRCRMLIVFLYDSAQRGYAFNGTAGRVLAAAQAVMRMNDPAYVRPAPAASEPALTEWPPGMGPPQPVDPFAPQRPGGEGS